MSVWLAYNLVMNKRIACLFLLLSLPLASKEQITLTLATTNWCPYTCIDEGFSSNIVGNYVTKLLSKHNIEVKIITRPWSRAIKSAEIGQVDGLLTAIHSEAPTLHFTQSPIAHFQVCFYANKAAHWQYSEPLNLQQFVLGVIQDYGYEDQIDQYILTNSNTERIVSLSGNEGTPRLLNMLIKGRVDIIVEDKLVLNWHIKRAGINITNIVNAGCMRAKPFYLALNNFKKSHQIILNILNKEFSSLENTIMLEKIILENSL